MSTTTPRKKRLFEIVPGQARPKRARTGAIFVGFSLLFVWVLFTKPHIPLISASGVKLTGDVSSGINIDPNQTPVRVDGVDVGIVTGVSRVPEGAQVTMQINDGTNVTLHDDASFSVRYRTVLGGTVYIDLNPGSVSAPRLGNSTIPLSRTSTQVEVDQILSVFNPTGRSALGTMIREFDVAFQHPQPLARTLDNLAPAMTNLAPALSAVRGTQPSDLTNVITSTSNVAAALSRDEVSLGGLIDNGAVALGVSAARSADLTATITGAPAALLQTQATALRLRHTLDLLDPLAESLVPGAQRLAPSAIAARATLQQARPVLENLVPLARTLVPTVNSVRAVSVTGSPVVDSLNNTVQRALTSFLPWLNSTDSASGLKVYEEIGPTLAAGNSATSIGDSTSPMANFEAGAGTDLLDGALGNQQGGVLTKSAPAPSGKVWAKDLCAVPKLAKLIAQPGGLISCELLSRVMDGTVAGINPANVVVQNSLLPEAQVLAALKSTIGAGVVK